MDFLNSQRFLENNIVCVLNTMFVFKWKCQNVDSFLNDSKLSTKNYTIYLCCLYRALVTPNPVCHSEDRAS